MAVLTARDHQDLGSCLCGLGSLGVVNEFHDKNIDPSTMCDDHDLATTRDNPVDGGLTEVMAGDGMLA